MDLLELGERLLTESFLDEAPTWAPNGRVLMFFRESPRDSQGRGVHAAFVDLVGRQNLFLGVISMSAN